MGDHWYNAGLFDKGEFTKPDVKYAVFDDMMNGLKAGYFNYKQWLGGQQEFTIQDKYARKQTIKWGKPTIWCCNEDPRFDQTAGFIDWAWMDANVMYYEVTDAIFRASTE